MLEGGEVADLGDQPDRGQGVDAAQAAQPADGRRPLAIVGLLGDQPVEALAGREQDLVAGQYSPSTTRPSGSPTSSALSHAP
jgi:hypothetical protein